MTLCQFLSSRQCEITQFHSTILRFLESPPDTSCPEGSVWLADGEVEQVALNKNIGELIKNPSVIVIRNKNDRTLISRTVDCE